MASVNKVILVGNLGRDPEVRYLPSGDAVANVTIATSSKYKGKDGNMVEETEWHRVTFFGKLAEIVGQYLRKGSQVYVEGSLRTRSWEKDGVKQYSTEIRADQMQMLGSRQGMGGPGAGHDDGAGYEAPRQSVAPASRAPAPARAPARRPASVPRSRRAARRPRSSGARAPPRSSGRRSARSGSCWPR